MGDKSNYFHNFIVRPDTERLLEVKSGDLVLDIACGNGNFSQRLVEMGATVVAFDYCEKLIEHANKRRAAYLHKIDFHVCDATDYQQLTGLKQEKPFDKAVANMAIMDISDIEPLFKAVFEMLTPQGVFVFSTHHPCFVKPHDTYVRPCVFEGVAIKGQPVLHFYYHRSLDVLFNICLNAGFVLNGFCEKVDEDKETPVIIIVRLLKP
jgi:2-polyprenyl-3-methyl-5-hydroxy-6-metoxy-1,4-benzoquinol methylase